MANLLANILTVAAYVFLIGVCGYSAYEKTHSVEEAVLVSGQVLCLLVAIILIFDEVLFNLHSHDSPLQRWLKKHGLRQ